MSVRNLDPLFRPGSVALIGASEREGSVGAAVTRNLLGGGFSGDIWLVNPRHKRIFDCPAWPDVGSLPAVPDLAVVATPASTVEGVIKDLAEKGCRTVVVITAGFGEGADGRGGARGQALLDAARPHLLRIVGPNCVGLMLPRVGLNASFAAVTPPGGALAIVSQSGAIVTAVADWAADRGIGFSSLISMGDMLDVDFGDVLDMLAQDSKTKAVLLYVEAITHARKFMSAARALSRLKPVIVMKSGRHTEGALAAASHTGAMAGSDATYDAAFRRAGLVRVYTMDEMFAAVETLALTDPPPGDRLAIVSNGGGFGVLATDALMDFGGRLAELSPETVKTLDSDLPSTWSGANPIDIIGDATGARYAATLEAVGADSGVDAIIALNAPTALASSQDAARAAIAAALPKDVPLLTAWLGGEKARTARQLFVEAGIPTFDSPSDAVRAFMHLVEYRRGQQALRETPPSIPEGEIPPDIDAARRIVDAALQEGRELLTEPEAKAILAAYHIPVVPTQTVVDAGEAAGAAERLGFPVVLKILSRQITHKSDVGGVALNLADGAEVREAASRMLEQVSRLSPGASIDGFVVQPMVSRPHAHELILGASEDPQFGPVLLFGHGGTATEAVSDTAVALPPLNLLLARQLMERTQIWRLLRGFRDRPAADLHAVAVSLVRVSTLIADLEQVAELDINPLLADETGVIALDARIVIRPAAAGERAVRLSIRPYPTELEDIVQHRGGRYLIRPIRPEDEPGLVAAFQSMSPKDIRTRFFALMKVFPSALAARLTQIDYDREMAFVLLDEPAQSEDAGTGQTVGAPEFEHALGVVRMSADPDFETAEFAITIRSGKQNRGYGHLLLARLIDYARQRGLSELYGQVLSDNRHMIDLGRSLGFKATAIPEERGTVRLTLALGQASGPR